MSGSRQRPQLKGPKWIIILISLVSIFLIAVYIFPPRSSVACYIFSTPGCSMYKQLLRVPARELTDDETAAQVVIKELLKLEHSKTSNPKVAFMFLIPGKLPFESLWEKFFKEVAGHSFFLSRALMLVHKSMSKLKDCGPIKIIKDTIEDLVKEHQVDINKLNTNVFISLGPRLGYKGHEDKFSIYVHVSMEKQAQASTYFVGRDIGSDKVTWGKISTVDAEKRLLTHSLVDPDNQHFVLLSESCVPLHKFNYVYNYLMFSNMSFIDSFVDPGPHGNGRYSVRMMPEVEKKDFRKGSQWFSMKRQHAMIIMADSLYYRKFKLHCKPNMEGRNCYSDEHYFPTLFNMVDPNGIANWSVTHVDWSEGKWHPRSYTARQVTRQLLKNIRSIDVSRHVTSSKKKRTMTRPCLWNGAKRPCYLFARRFLPDAQQRLMRLFSNYTKV